MFNDADYPHPVPSFNYPVPAPDTDAELDPLLCVRFNAKWLPYIIGALKQLALPSTWDTETDSENAIAVSRAQDLLYVFSTATPCDVAPVEALDCGDDCMGCCLRFQDGRLQCFACGEWTDVPGQGAGTSQPGQPGSGSAQPRPGGGTQEYCGTINNGGKWLLPTKVSSGDTLLFSLLDGAWHDNLALFWNCPDGYTYIDGLCVLGLHYEGTDPMPGVLHMSIVGDIGGTFYDVLNTSLITGNPQTFTVPGGITDAQVMLQANNDTLANVVGSVGFCVSVTNNAAAPWSHTLDFRVSDYGFVDNSDPGCSGTWTPGTGWVMNGVAGANTYIDKLIATGTTVKRATLQSSYPLHGGSSLLGLQCPTGTAIAFAAPVTTDPQTVDSGPVSVVNPDGFQFKGSDNGSTYTLTHLVFHVEGEGVDPFPGAPTP